MANGLGVLLSALCLALWTNKVKAMEPVAPYVNLGTVEAVQDLLQRQLPGAESHFVFALDTKGCPGGVKPPCFGLSDGPGGVVEITATGAAELASGLGYFLRERWFVRSHNFVVEMQTGVSSQLHIYLPVYCKLYVTGSIVHMQTSFIHNDNPVDKSKLTWTAFYAPPHILH